MLNLTKEQIKESLERLRDYSYFMYNDLKFIDNLYSKVIEFENNKIILNINDDGKIKLIVNNDTEILYDVFIHTAKSSGGPIENLKYEYIITNKKELTQEYIEFGMKIAWFVLSYFQRLVAFTFFSRMQNETIDAMANDLRLEEEKL